MESHALGPGKHTFDRLVNAIHNKSLDDALHPAMRVLLDAGYKQIVVSLHDNDGSDEDDSVSGSSGLVITIDASKHL